MRRAFLPLFALCVFALAGLPIAPARAYVQGTVFPILFLHGFSSTSAYDCSNWATAKSYFQLHGWNGALISVGYYSGDINCDVSIVDWSSQHDGTDHCANDYAGNDGTNNEDLRHVACELNWYLWDNWGSHQPYPENADIVAHSMAGLIVRWMLAAHGGSYPPATYMQDVQTTGTPMGGMATALPCGCLQAQEMLATDDFMQALTTSAQDPQATDGTDWTMIGSQCDSNTSLDMDGGHKVEYISPCYTHPSYYNDTVATDDAVVMWSDGAPRDSVPNSSSAWPHMDHDMLLAMSSQGW